MINFRNTIQGVAIFAALSVGSVALAQPGTAKHAMPEPKMHMMNDGDFAQMMKMHHQDGIAMAKLEEAKGANSALKALATKIQQDQTREVAELEAWSQRHPMTPSADAKAHEQKMAKEHAASMAKLDGASGASLDHMFAMQMAMHHEMAIKMVNETQFKDAELKKMAGKMKVAQTAEIKQLKQHRAP